MVRKAKISEIVQIQKLINRYAEKDLMLPRSLSELYENLRDLFVSEDGGSLLGCCALHVSWQDLAELKSLAVDESHKGKGIGRALIEAVLKEAKELKINKVFVLTYVPELFKKYGFKEISREELPHKVWNECINCPKFPDCQEVPMVKPLGNDK